MRSVAPALGMILFVAGTACTHTPLAPDAPPRPAAPPGPVQQELTRIRLVSGWDGSPVGKASGSVNGVAQRTTEEGVVEGTFALGGPLDVAMPGFLRRTTRISSGDTTLWPIADDQEADAIREILYDWYDDLVPLQHAVSTLELVLDDRIVAERPDAVNVWRDAANQVSEITEGRVRFVGTGEHANGRIRIWIDHCQMPWVCRDGPYGGGPSQDRTDASFHINSSGIAARPDVALRACVLSAIDFKGFNPLPGLLNLSDPAPRLSDFERRLVRMATLRHSGTSWPDSDF